eukprot:96726_1
MTEKTYFFCTAFIFYNLINMTAQATTETTNSPFTSVDITPTSSVTPDHQNNINVSINNIISAKPLPQYTKNGLAAQQCPFVTITKEQVLLVLRNELKSRHETTKLIEQRLITDRKQFEDIENALNSKINKYQQTIKQKLKRVCVQGMQQNDLSNIHQLLDEIVSVDEQSKYLKKEVRKKKWYEDKNEIYRIVSSNHELMNEIDNTTQTIDYWQRMIRMTSFPETENASAVPIQTQNEVQAMTPFVVKEVLRIKSENEKMLIDLRKELDQIRATRN